MLKKYILGIFTFLAFFVLNTFPIFAQEDRQLTEYDYSVTSEYDYEQLYDSLDNDFRGSIESYNNLSPEDMAIAESMAAVFGGAFIFIFIILGVFSVVMYVVMSWALMVIAKKMGIKDAWFAWIPILNLVLMNRMAGISDWVVLLFLVPGVNAIYAYVIMVLATMKACEKFGLEKMLSLLMLLPVVNLFFLGYLAWGKHSPKKAEVVNE